MEAINDLNNQILKSIEVLDPTLQKTIKGIIKNEGYQNYEIIKRDFNTGGGNFLGELCEIDIKGETDDGEKETSIFSKKIITVENMTLASVPELYRKEFIFYSDISKYIVSLQDQVDLPKKYRFVIPKLYTESNEHILIFENLAKKGFKTYERSNNPALKFVELSIQELAKFHGSSFVIEYKMPDIYEKKIKTMKNSYFFDEDWEELMKNVFLKTANLFDGEIKQKFEDFLPIAIKKMQQYEFDQTTVRCCLTHADYRVTNILMREANGEPEEVIILDYQLIHYGCPIKDFVFFIYSCTDRDFRKDHLDDLKELYFKTLSKYLGYFDLDVELVFPREEFDKVYREWLDYGLIKVMFASPFLFAPATGLDVAHLSLSELPFEPDEDFK